MLNDELKIPKSKYQRLKELTKLTKVWIDKIANGQKPTAKSFLHFFARFGFLLFLPALIL